MRVVRSVLIAFAGASVASCAAILGIDDGIPRGDGGADVVALDAAGDAGADADAAAPACDLDASFGAPVALTTLNTSADENHPRLLPGELTVFFQRIVTNDGFDLFTATRASTSDPFGAPAPITELNTTSNDADLFVTTDGLRAYFASDRPGGLGGYDIWQASRDASAAPFGLIAPTANVSSTSSDSTTYYVPGALYFASNRGSGGLDIYRAEEQSGGFAAPLLVTELASPASDAFPVVSTDELRIYFASTRGDAGGYQVYTATRAVSSAPWETPTLVTELATAATDVIPSWISPDGCRLYLSDDASGNYDTYFVSK